ncbi:hypothetical protein HELRODRAFT_183847 [Helobdella robusta]|uniref:Tetratricopeptide repeat protein 37 n=1 Tax=Helobdella robusta TaxID=6412 RepID=T1FK95_HELRO|nr:hypothetical protein HELRODRAFT_183847 [Helobdella robusta]ESO09801.1 hypothetical protein HELRODRAFT_183847 [Helobdella robusta]
MDQKKIKETLKKANLLIKQKNYPETIVLCKEIIGQDEDNYMGHVFMGAALEGVDNIVEAFAAYKKAISIDDKQLLAWQGLGKLYENKSKNDFLSSQKTFFINVFEKLGENIKDNESKKIENDVKLCQLYFETKDHDKFLAVYILINNDLITKKNITEKYKIDKCLMKLFQEKNDIDDNLKYMVLDSSKFLSEYVDGDRSIRQEAWMLYLKLIQQIEKLGTADIWKLVTEKCPISNCTPNDEIVLHIFMDTYPDVSNYPIDNLVENMKKPLVQSSSSPPQSSLSVAPQSSSSQSQSSSQSSLSLVLCLYEAFCDIHHGKYKEALIKLEKTLKLIEQKNHHTYFGDIELITKKFHITISKNNLQLKDEDGWRYALDICSKYIDEGVDCSIKCDLELAIVYCMAAMKLGTSCCDSDHHRRFVEILEKISDIKDTDDDYFRYKKCIILGHVAFYKERILSKALSFYERASRIIQTNFEAFYHVALTYWDILMGYKSLDSKKEDLVKWDTEIKLDTTKMDTLEMDTVKEEDGWRKVDTEKLTGSVSGPGSKDDWDSLGLDEERMKINFMQNISTAIKLDSLHAKAYYVLGLYFTRVSPNLDPKWVLLRLSDYHIKNDRVSEAIDHLQTAIRRDANDLRVWERLGAAYLLRGSYTSALKAFQKVLNSEPGAIYSIYQYVIFGFIIIIH